MAMNVGITRMSFFVSSGIIIHLGMKPVSGVSPPMESKVSMVRVVITGIIFHVWDSDSVVVVEFWVNNVNVVGVIVI